MTQKEDPGNSDQMSTFEHLKSDYMTLSNRFNSHSFHFKQAISVIYLKIEIKVKVSTMYKSINFLIQHAWVALHVACHVTSSVTLVTLYITIVSHLCGDQR